MPRCHDPNDRWNMPHAVAGKYDLPVSEGSFIVSALLNDAGPAKTTATALSTPATTPHSEQNIDQTAGNSSGVIANIAVPEPTTLILIIPDALAGVSASQCRIESPQQLINA